MMDQRKPHIGDTVFDERRIYAGDKPHGKIIDLSNHRDEVLIKFDGDYRTRCYSYEDFSGAEERNGEWRIYQEGTIKVDWSNYREASQFCKGLGQGNCLVKNAKDLYEVKQYADAVALGLVVHFLAV